MRVQGAFLSIFAALLSLAASAAPSKSEVHLGLLNAPVNLDWTGLASFAEAPLILNLCQGLYSLDPKTGEPRAAIAESVTKSEDSKLYTFQLNKNAKWSDGRPIYAKDFVDAWERVLAPQSVSIYSYYFYDIQNAKEYQNGKFKSFEDVGIRAIGDFKLLVKLKRPHPQWETLTSFWPFFPIRKDLVKKYGENWTRAGVLTSSGAYVYDSYEPGKKITLKINPYFLNKGKQPDSIVIHFAASFNALLKSRDAGKVDLVQGIPYTEMASLTSRKDFRKVPLFRHQMIAINSKKYPMTNRNFRLAILSAIDTSKLLPHHAKHFKLAHALIPAPLLGSQAKAKVPFDIEAAKKYLKKSGVIVNEKLRLRILTNIFEPYVTFGKSIQEQLQENLGIKVELSALQHKEYTAYMNIGDYGITTLTWTSKVLSPQDFLLPYSGEAAHSRVSVPSNDYDQGLLEAIAATTSERKTERFERAQQVITEEQAILNPLFFETGGALVGSKIKSIEFNHMGVALLWTLRTR